MQYISNETVVKFINAYVYMYKYGIGLLACKEAIFRTDKSQMLLQKNFNLKD